MLVVINVEVSTDGNTQLVNVVWYFGGIKGDHLN